MIFLKETNHDDWKEEFGAISKIPAKENGFENVYAGVDEKYFKDVVIQELIDHSNGIGLPEGYVPDTYYFLWDDNKIVGLFKIRHFLNDFLAKGPGHIGYSILPEYRKMGYGTKGLQLAIEKCREIIPEDEIYLSVHKDNVYSLKVQKNNGAYIVREDDEEYYTRIRISDKESVEKANE